MPQNDAKCHQTLMCSTTGAINSLKMEVCAPPIPGKCQGFKSLPKPPGAQTNSEGWEAFIFREPDNAKP